MHLLGRTFPGRTCRYPGPMSDWREQLREHGRNFFSNWSESDLGFWERSRVFAKNRAKGLVNGGCCGNHGQPGC